MKWPYSLKANLPSSPETKSWRFPNKCPTRKVQRKSPDIAIQYFRAKEEPKSPLEVVAMSNLKFNSLILTQQIYITDFGLSKIVM